MNVEQIKMLTRIKKLITQKKCHFAIRKDRNYLEELLFLGITEEEAWSHILTLNINFYFADPKPNYAKNKNALTFKKVINGKLAYIKVGIDELTDEVEAVCISFHQDRK